MKSGKCDVCKKETHPDNLRLLDYSWQSDGALDICYECRQKYEKISSDLRKEAYAKLDQKMKEIIRADASLPPELPRPKKKFLFFIPRT